ncbi:MAG: phosphoglycerate kinase [delta proteobacterium ML8_F1]|nr:MAG: phosphoglycerate kinase [delta proteobacterium ML8_F1]
MFDKMTIRDVALKDKKVLVRCDFNVPLKDGVITDETRILGAMPTIEYLVEKGARVILCSHMGKPKGEYVPSLSLSPVAVRLGELLGKPVEFVSSPRVVDAEVQSRAGALKGGEVMLLENTRFRVEETQNGEAFSRDLADLAEIFVNDAFGTAHRAHSSTVGVAEFLRPAVSGFLIEKELAFLGKAVEAPKRPFVAVLGGAKVSDKIKVIDNLLSKVNGLIIGGAMAYTFLKAQGYAVGTSMVEEDSLEYAREMIAKAHRSGVELLLPIDHRVATEFKDVPAILTRDANIPEGHMGLDIGEMTIGFFSEALHNARTVLWNGPMGVFEFQNYNKGTLAIAETLAMGSAITIIGGGDSAAAVTQLGFADQLTHISTGGGASLEFLEGKVLPGIAALNDLKEEKNQ